MPDFNIDNLKKNWQEQDVKPKYDNNEILKMLNRKSRNYVKYIFWISIFEFLLFLGITVYYLFDGGHPNSFINLLTRLGIKETPQIQAGYEHLDFFMKILSLFITAFFMIRFYINYKKINIEENLKQLIIRIINFKRTVNIFILTNLALLVVFTLTLAFFIFNTLSQQNIHLNDKTLTGFVFGFVITLMISIILAWLYYRIVYGIILKKLNKNLHQLKEVEEQTE